MKKVVALLPVEDFWRPMLVAIFCFVLLAGLLTYRLGSITPGFTDSELQQRSTALSAKAIVDNPLNLHQKVGQFAVQKLGHKGPAAMRAPSALIGFFAIIGMYIILKNWYTARIALLGTFLFATSSWTLHVSRLATPDINYLLPLLLVVGGVWLHRNKLGLIATTLTLASGISLFYIPGMVWLILFIALWRWRFVRHAFKRLNISQRIMTILLVLLGLGPLIWAFIMNSGLIMTWLGLPSTWPSPVTYLSNLVTIPQEIFIKGSGNPVYGIGNLPLLDAFTSCMVVLGVFASFFRLKLDRTRLLIGIASISTLLIAFGGPVGITFLLPVVYILASAGIALLLQQWFTVFPLNPVARALGVILLSSTILLASGYHISRYFIAWPHVPATKSSFSRQP